MASWSQGAPKIEASRNMCAFLDMIAWSEIGPAMLNDPATDHGYRVIVGSLPGNLRLMDSYDTHPIMNDSDAVDLGNGLYSTASGRYQILNTYWPYYRDMLGLPDFSPLSQDRYALQQIREQRAISDIEAGRIRAAIDKCANIWASLVGAGYTQHEHSYTALERAYVAAGGSLG